MDVRFHRRLLVTGAIDEPVASALVESAVKLAAAGPVAPTRLRGMNLALLRGQGLSANAQRFEVAALALGARVAHVDLPALPAAGWPVFDAESAALLDRLYDAIDVEDTPPGVAAELHGFVAAPVFHGLADDSHPVQRLFDRVRARRPDPGGEAARLALVQAALLAALA